MAAKAGRDVYGAMQTNDRMANGEESSISPTTRAFQADFVGGMISLFAIRIPSTTVDRA